MAASDELPPPLTKEEEKRTVRRRRRGRGSPGRDREGIVLHTSTQTNTGYRCVTEFKLKLGVSAYEVTASETGGRCTSDGTSQNLRHWPLRATWRVARRRQTRGALLCTGTWWQQALLIQWTVVREAEKCSTATP